MYGPDSVTERKKSGGVDQATSEVELLADLEEPRLRHVGRAQPRRAGRRELVGSRDRLVFPCV